MSDQQKREFEQRFSRAVAEGLSGVKASAELRARLMGRLGEASKEESRPDLSEDEAGRFERGLARAVEKSQEWSPEDELVLRTEARLSGELQKNVLSERSVRVMLDSGARPAELEGLEVEEKSRFLQALRSEVKRSTGELKAPESVRGNALGLVSQSTPVAAPTPPVEQKKKSAIVPFPGKTQWKRGLSALTSLAAGFALLIITLFGSADVALANSVRADHKMCCEHALQFQKDGPPKGLQAMLESKFGKVPVPPVDPSWSLRVSKLCKTDDGQPMVHLLYTRGREGKDLQSMSLHFLPAENGKRLEQYSIQDPDVHELSGGDFPVMAWKEGDWVCTACSPELDEAALQRELKGL